MTVMTSYLRAQDEFDAILAAVTPGQWDLPSACIEWTVRDVAGHVIWGQEQLRHWASGQDYINRTGAPGAPHPAELAGADPVQTWRSARARSVESLTDEALGRMISLPGMGEVPLAAMVTTFATDHLVHAWDIAHALGLATRLDPELVSESFAWARDGHALRAPGFFGPELTPPAEAHEQTRWLAFLGRAAWHRVPA